jgi:curved DNA-binding protein CbpA
MMEIPLTGNIRDFSLSKILVYLSRNRKTGTLIVKIPAFTKKVFLDKGDAIFASSTYEDDRLGEMLIKAGKITIEQYEESVKLLKIKNKRQGAILVELGYLTPKDLFWGVKYQVKEIIYSLFPLEDAEYEFVEGEIPANEVITLKMSMGNLVYEGVKKISNLIRMKNELPDTESAFQLSTDPASLFQDIEFSPQDQKMLSMIDGKRTIKELIDSSSVGTFEALKTLYALWSTGTIEEKEKVIEKPEEAVTVEDILKPFPEEEEAFVKRVDELYSNIEKLTANELLEINKNSDAETIKKNYYRLAKEFHPDRYFASNNPEIKDKLPAIFDAISQAYMLLKDDDARKEYFDSLGRIPKEEDLTPKDAEEQFRRGVEEFKKGNFWGAADAFKWAIKLNGENAKYWSHLSLAYSRMDKKLKDAEEALLEAIKLEPLNADHYANLGHIYLMAGMKKRAYSQFEKALKLDPGNAKAQKGLKQTEV